MQITLAQPYQTATIINRRNCSETVQVKAPTHSRDVTWYCVKSDYYCEYSWLSHNYLLACGYTLPAPLDIDYTHKNVLQP